MAFLLCCAILPAFASQPPLVASFDDLLAGSAGTSFTDGGITFSNLDQRAFGGAGSFGIVSTTQVLTGLTPPNYLTFGIFSTGAQTTFGRLGSADILFSGQASSASMDAFGKPVAFIGEGG